jgi:hypothetical protein
MVLGQVLVPVLQFCPVNTNTGVCHRSGICGGLNGTGAGFGPSTSVLSCQYQYRGLSQVGDLWWTKWHWGRFWSQYFSFVLSIPFHQCSTFISVYMLLLPEVQMGETWGPATSSTVSKFGQLWTVGSVIWFWVPAEGEGNVHVF